MAISDRPADRLVGLDKIKSPDWSKEGMFIIGDVIEVDEFDKVDICCCRKIRQIREGRGELCHTRTFFVVANLHGLTRPPAWVPCFISFSFKS